MGGIYLPNFLQTQPLIELRNLVNVSEMIVDSAFHRKESRGAHYSVNYPQMKKTTKDTLIRKTVVSEILNSKST